MKNNENNGMMEGRNKGGQHIRRNENFLEIKRERNNEILQERSEIREKEE